MKKRFLCIIFALLMLVVLPVVLRAASAEAYSGQCGENLTWTFDPDTGTLTISGSGATWEFDRNTNLPPWYAFRESIVYVDLSEGITGIGGFAFDQCTAMETVTIPDSVTSIGEAAFFRCRALNEISFPNELTEIGRYAFCECERLTEVVIPDSVTTVSEGLFYQCRLLSSAVIGNGTTKIGNKAFYYCSRLTAVTIGNSVTSIGQDAFRACDMSEITIPNGVKTIGERAFYDCRNLTEITIPDSVTDVGVAAFYYCTSLKLAVIGDGVTGIWSRAFEHCLELTEITLGKSVATIDSQAFYACPALTDVFYHGTPNMRNGIRILSENEPLINATWHYLPVNAIEMKRLPNKLVYAENEALDVTGGAIKTCYDYEITEEEPLTAEMVSGYDGTKLGKQTLNVTFGGKTTTFDVTVIDSFAPTPTPTPDPTETATQSPTPTPKPVFNGTVELNPNDMQLNGKTPYRIYNGKAQTPGVIVKDKNGKTVGASKYIVSYRNNMQPGTAYADVTMKDTGAKTSVWFKIYLPPTTETTVENVDDGIKISWKKVDGAKGYVIYRRAWNLVDKGWTTFERWNNTTETAWTDTKVYAGTRYQYGIKAYFSDPMDNYNLGIVGPLKTTVRITTRTLNSVTPGSKKLTVKWTGSSVFTGYEVQVATNATFTKDVKTVTVSKAKTCQTVMKGLKKATTYFVRVRSYHIFEGTKYYGGWSNVLNGKTK